MDGFNLAVRPVQRLDIDQAKRCGQPAASVTRYECQERHQSPSGAPRPIPHGIELQLSRETLGRRLGRLLFEKYGVHRHSIAPAIREGVALGHTVKCFDVLSRERRKRAAVIERVGF